MKRQGWRPQFVNIHGQPWSVVEHGRPDEPAPEKAPPKDPAALGLTPADVERVFDALCLAGWQRGKTPLQQLLRGLGWRRSDGRAFGGEELGAALRALVDAGRVHRLPDQGYRLDWAQRRVRLPALLEEPAARDAWRVWAWASSGAYGPLDGPTPWANVRQPEEAESLWLLVLGSGMTIEAYNATARKALAYASAADAPFGALAKLVEIGAQGRVDPRLWWALLGSLDQDDGLRRHPALLGWIDTELGRAGAAVPFHLRLRIAERRLHAGRFDTMEQALAADAACAPYLPVLQAGRAAYEGSWAAAATAFAAALKALGAAAGKRRGLVPRSLQQWQALALIAQPEVAAWTAARKLCVAESGSREPSEFDPWGRWAHAVAVRLGDARIEPKVFAAAGGRLPSDPDVEADKLILAAWLDQRPEGWSAAHVQAVADALHAQGLPWKADLLAQAAERFGLTPPARPADAPPPWAPRFFAPAQAAWRDALAAIVALGDGRAATAEAPLQSLRWRLSLDDEGRVANLEVFEPAASARARPKPLTLAALKKRTRLDPRDAAVARGLRASPYDARRLSIDLAAAAQALVGHPALELADAPGLEVELRKSLPVLQVQRQRGADGAECFVFQLEDRLLADAPPDLDHHFVDYGQRAAETERRDGLRIVREAADRARLIRITPAQRRVAELVAKRWTVPVDAQAELDAALRVLSGHFVLHSDAQAGEPVPSDSRLLAQLQPRGDAIELRLVVRPFGGFGPLLAPGAARARLMTMHQGVSLATERDLGAERASLSAVLDALPFLGEAPAEAAWLIDDPELALAAVQTLGRMSETADSPVRALEWPKGKPLRVLDADASAMKATLKTGRDWFAIDGELRIDEQRVLPLQQLLGLLREAGGSRFVALGEGRYLALAERLRQRLAELDALAEADAKGLKVGASAAAWLADAAPDLGAAGDKGWRDRAAALERAAALDPALPSGLQATLRPYQHEGFVWLMRLAEAGFGACLADDMGLGKTVQTLALLLARADRGPALVVAPTSVCANWAAETERFAPALRCAVYGEGDRAGQLAQAAAGDLVVVSYALLLRDAEAFAARDWATLVLDEAQALKNAATQRAKAVGTLQAGFRLALSGTPVENRLADLWSIMNLLNPGLLGSANRFGERFAGPIERQRSDAARARLRRLVAPFLLRRTKAQVLTDLPPRTEIVHRVEPGPEERAFLEAARRSAVERVAAIDVADSRSAFNVLAELTRLRRAACDPRLAAPELGLVGAKVQAFEALAAELVDAQHKALVFSQFTDFLKLLAQRLDAAGLRYQYLDGSTPAAARAERVAAFQRGEGELFLISLKAGGYGLNLTAADYVVIADPWWNPAAEDQAMGRAHRIGQQRPVTVYRLVTAGSIEERIVGLHQDKRELAEGLLSGQDGGAPLRAEELIELLRE
jgi:superfamily II DNA or RNA helicase